MTDGHRLGTGRRRRRGDARRHAPCCTLRGGTRMRVGVVVGSCFVLAGCTLGDVDSLGVEPGSWDGAVPSSCVDGVKNGSESDVDCGGDACSPCGLAAKCGGHGDCESGYCAGGACAAPSCG